MADNGASNVDGAIGGYEAFHIGQGRWKIRCLPFAKPNGGVTGEYVYCETFDSEHEANIHIKQALIGTR